MALEIFVISADGKSKQKRSLQPGTTTIELNPGETVALTESAQGAGFQLIPPGPGGTNLIIVHAEGEITIPNFTSSTNRVDLTLPDGTTIPVTPKSDLNAINQQLPPPGNSLQVDKVVGIPNPGDASFAEDSSGAAGGGGGGGGGGGSGGGGGGGTQDGVAATNTPAE